MLKLIAELRKNILKKGKKTYDSIGTKYYFIKFASCTVVSSWINLQGT